MDYTHTHTHTHTRLNSFTLHDPVDELLECHISDSAAWWIKWMVLTTHTYTHTHTHTHTHKKKSIYFVVTSKSSVLVQV